MDRQHDEQSDRERQPKGAAPSGSPEKDSQPVTRTEDELRCGGHNRRIAERGH